MSDRTIRAGMYITATDTRERGPGARPYTCARMQSMLLKRTVHCMLDALLSPERIHTTVQSR